MAALASLHRAIAVRIAVRELRAGIRGFGIFLACLALGVMAIAGVSAVSAALSGGLESQGRLINGGDIEFSLVGREASPAEVEFLKKQGKQSVIASTRAMLRTVDGQVALVEVKAVDSLYPLIGEARLASGQPLDSALSDQPGQAGAVADPALLARLGSNAGTTATLGSLRLNLADTLTSEPDKLAGGISFAPRLIIRLDALRASGLIQPGSVIYWRYRIALPDGVLPADIKQQAETAFPQAGWEIRTRDNASPEIRRNIERFTMFIALVGLTSLLVGGVGVANAVSAFIERQRNTIATLKSLGASNALVTGIYLTQTMLLATLGIGIGLLAGAALPWILAYSLSGSFPLPINPALNPDGLALAALYGFLTALAFSLVPLGHVRNIGVASLFRQGINPGRKRPGVVFTLICLVPVLAVMALAVLTSQDKRVASLYIGAALCAFVLLRLVAWLVMKLARHLPRPRNTALRMALANIHRPGAATPSVMLSLGLGLCLLVALVLIDGNIRYQLAAAIPDKAPGFFFVDIRQADTAPFETFINQHAPAASLKRVPMLRGRIIAVNGTAADKLAVPPRIAWVLSGDRGITISETVPDGSRVVEGQWWPSDYAGPPLVSMEQTIAKGLGLRIGDSITVNVLGRNISARLSALRKLEWESFGINFVLVFSPDTFQGAPVSNIASLTWPSPPGDAYELGFLKKAADAFPGITIIRVRDRLEALAAMAGQLAMAIRVAALIALASSILVLAGALAAGQKNRLYDAVVLKVLGATRRRILFAYVLEYGILGLVTAVFGVAAGTLTAWIMVTELMDFSFRFLPGETFAAALGAMTLTIFFGLAGTWRILQQKPARHLRSL